jgi:hypothetical protein
LTIFGSGVGKLFAKQFNNNNNNNNKAKTLTHGKNRNTRTNKKPIFFLAISHLSIINLWFRGAFPFSMVMKICANWKKAQTCFPQDSKLYPFYRFQSNLVFFVRNTHSIHRGQWVKESKKSK